ncbi:MAG: hypothetical protein WAK55_27350, partial [Xanthobacteraceae bacterium]
MKSNAPVRRFASNFAELPELVQGCDKPNHGSQVQRYFFTIRGRDRVIEDDPVGTYLPNVEAALSYA